jgi:hypothetical protein
MGNSPRLSSAATVEGRCPTNEELLDFCFAVPQPQFARRRRMMFDPLFAYFGPETLMPVASILGAIGGVVMIFGRTIVRLASRSVRVLLRK